jgi:RNA polymerase sigma-70 factor (ECF subfamily)
MTDWPQIITEYGPLVWRTAQRLLRHEADAADCFQRTFISAVEVCERETVRNWPGLLCRLATARALEQLRQRSIERERFAVSKNGSQVDAAVDHRSTIPELAAQADELAETLRKSLSKIEPRQAEVFCHVCLDEFSYAETAEQLGITPNHVGVLLNRAKAALREQLESFHLSEDIESKTAEGKP